MRIKLLEISRICKCFTLAGVQIDRTVFCLTLLWYYKERYDSGVGLFRIAVGKFIERENKIGINIEFLGFSWNWYKSVLGKA